MNLSPFFLERPKSAIYAYPLVSKIIFSGVILRCIICLLCKSLNPNITQAIINSKKVIYLLDMCICVFTCLIF